MYVLDEPLQWDEVLDIVSSREFTRFGRSVNVDREYRFFKKRYNANDVIRPQLQGHRYVFLPNRYPYYLEDAYHDVMWINDDLSDQEIATAIEAAYPYQLVYFENPHNLRSVPDIRHIHIIFRLPPELTEDTL